MLNAEFKPRIVQRYRFRVIYNARCCGLPLLEAHSITKKYGKLLAVDNLSLTVSPGFLLGLLGPNGAGKSTTIRMMCGLLQPDSGKVLLDGQQFRAGVAAKGGRAAGVSRIGICPQEVSVWPNLTCMEQIEFIGELHRMPNSAVRRRGSELLERVGLIGKSTKLPRALSGGMQRRLNIVLALVHDPDIVILDEPEAGLDSQSRVVVREYIKELSHTKAVILTTHNMDEAERMADQVAIIDRGRLLALGAPHDLKRIHGKGSVLELSFEASELGMTQMLRVNSALNSLSNKGKIHIKDKAKSEESSPATKSYDSPKHRDSSVEIHMNGELEVVADVLNSLHQAGLLPTAMSLRESTLEDVFLELTGRGLRE